jgi:NAD(P)-dependent dehydrogenase (short-subunit alcohol dehydrogenase family)
MGHHRPDEVSGAGIRRAQDHRQRRYTHLIDTPLTRHRTRYEQAADDLQSKQPTAVLEEEARERLIAKTPLGVPWIEPEAIAPAVVFLASDEAAMVSGATYDVTGGDSARYTA